MDTVRYCIKQPQTPIYSLFQLILSIWYDLVYYKKFGLFPENIKLVN
ncbi:MAG: hypothetical protein NT175_00560 [Bacteroidetes bacterium]|nr:hypothetical protein [Bacteroidota bacterium]